MSNIQEKLPHTAISTWSGFVYQGKIALLHCLNLIHTYNTSVSDYKLKLENVDDFAIHNKNDICLSMHQVKAYKNTRFSAYQDAIAKQYEDSKKYENIKAYFHTSRNIDNIPPNFLENYPSVKIYNYYINNNPQNYCGLNEIDSILESKIKEIYIDYYNNIPYKSTSEYISISRNVLENIVLNKVILIHHRIQMTPGSFDRKIASEEYIDFNLLFEILQKDLTTELLNETYFLDMLRKDIGIIYKEFCDEIDIENGDVGDFVKLRGYISKINMLDINGMNKFIRSILPHKKGTFKTIKDYNMETFDESDLKEGLFYILDLLVIANNNCLHDKPNLFSWVNSNTTFYPTALSSGERFKRKICQNIIKNAIDDDVEFLYESGTLVTTHMTSDNIYNDVYSGPSSHSENSKHNKISQFKSVSLISIDNVPQSLLHERNN